MTTNSREELVLTAWQVAQIIDHARTARPAEACGLLGGRGGRVERVYPLPNTEESSDRYLAEPQAQVDAVMEIEERGNEIVGIYHSHLGAPAYPSPIDVDMAAYPDAVYLIVSLQRKKPPELGAFHIRDGKIKEIDLVVESAERVRG